MKQIFSNFIIWRKFDYSTYIAGYFQPQQIRDHFYTIYWMNKELQRILDSTRELSLGMGKLDFWKDTINNLYKVFYFCNLE